VANISAKVFSFIIALYNVYFNRFWPKWGRVGAAIGKTLGFLRFVRKIGNVSKNGGNVSSSYSQKKRAESCGL
jgi:hypothetical protein